MNKLIYPKARQGSYFTPPALEIIDDKCSMLPGEGETKLCQVISYTATGWECDEGPVIFSEWSVERGTLPEPPLWGSHFFYPLSSGGRGTPPRQVICGQKLWAVYSIELAVQHIKSIPGEIDLIPLHSAWPSKLPVTPLVLLTQLLIKQTDAVLWLIAQLHPNNPFH